MIDCARKTIQWEGVGGLYKVWLHPTILFPPPTPGRRIPTGRADGVSRIPL